jgi:iron(III) transport system ATP-binding protein
LADLTFDVSPGECLLVVGPSGSGKSTLALALTGLIPHDIPGDCTGWLEVDGVDAALGMADLRGRVGLVFQDPDRQLVMERVEDDVAFGLENRAWPLEAMVDRVPDALADVGLAGFQRRRPNRLSGGEQQRLALARALVMEPKLLLLDEPLSNLDAKLRERMRFELKRIQRELGLTTIYVTHDQSEALALSHEIAVMHEGKIVQIGSPRDIYERPRTKFVADFIGTTNFLDGTVVGTDGAAGFVRVNTALGPLRVRGDAGFGANMPVVVSVRPEDVELSDDPPANADSYNLCTGLVDQKVFLGEYVDFQIKAGESLLLARAHSSIRTPVGDPIHMRMNPEKCIAIADAAPTREAA